MRLLVFVSSSCSHCPAAERVARKVSLEYSKYDFFYEKVRTRSPQGIELSKKYFIMSVPTLLFIDEEGNELGRIVGAPSEMGLRKKIEIILGIKEPFFKKLFSKNKSD